MSYLNTHIRLIQLSPSFASASCIPSKAQDGCDNVLVEAFIIGKAQDASDYRIIIQLNVTVMLNLMIALMIVD
jgi:hypothetical protein